MDSANPTTEAEALKLNNDVVAAVTKKLDPRTPPKDIDTTIKNVVALYQAKDEIKQGKQSSSGVRMWYEVIKEGAQAAILGFSATALVNLFVTFGIPVMTQESVGFAISNAESAAQATRWVSMVPLFGLALREVLRSRYKDPEFYAKGLESRLGGHH
jgi:3-keto-L-gulonate-6-phosphate decarboxylase